jgi:hypothetical protein
MHKIILTILFLIFAQETFSTEVTVFVTVRDIIQREIPPNGNFKIEISTGTEREIILEIPERTFISTVTITVEPRTDLPLPEKQANLKGTGIGVEINLSTTVELNQPVTVTLSYRAIIFTKEENLTLARFEEGKNTWQLLLSNIDKVNKKISTTVTKFSQFQIVEKVPSPNVDNVFVYPNPCYLNREKKINFARLPKNAEITIYTLVGEKVATFIANDSGDHTWSIETLASGVYIFLAKDPATGKKKTGKLAIIR